MRPATLRRILLIQALETADADGEILLPSDRKEATRDAIGSLTRDASEAEQDQFVGRRAESLTQKLTARFPVVEAAGLPPRRIRFFVPLVLLLALLFGWSTQALGLEKRVNILSFPLIGILGWNALVYLLELYRFLSQRFRATRSDHSAPPEGPLARLAEAAESLPSRLKQETSDADIPPQLRLGIANFQQRWRGLREPITWFRVRAVLHLAAALFAFAAIGGMYAKGIANEYRAYWESTFLDAPTVESLLHTILGPASQLSGITIPETASLQSTADDQTTVSQSGDAAPWIHLYAITIGLFVMLPRIFLAGLNSYLARRREQGLSPRSLPGAGLYFERLVAEALGTAMEVGAVPYCHRLSPTAEASLERDLERQLGTPIELDWNPAISLGEEEEGAQRLADAADSLPTHLVLCFNFAATPEEETHGALIRSAREALIEAESEAQLHVALDAQSFDEVRRRLADFSERRAERLQAWRSVAGPLRDQLSVFPDLES